MIGPGKHEGRGIGEVIVQRKPNIHLYFKPGQFIWESEIEAAPTPDVKAGVTQARKGGLSGQSQSGRCEGGLGGWPGPELPGVAPQSEERKVRGLQVASKGTAAVDWISGVV